MIWDKIWDITSRGVGMNGQKLIETLERVTSPLVELEMPAASVAVFVAMCEELGITYRVPDVRVIVPREKLLTALSERVVTLEAS